MRKLYAASLYALRADGRSLAECRAQVAELLREDPYARLDATQFEEGYRRLFEEVATELRDELDRITNERVAERRRLEEERAARRALGMRILTTETVVQRSPPRALTLAPFGTGQFVNGDAGAGWALLATEVTLAVGCLTATSLYAALLAERDVNVTAGSSRGNAIEAAYYTSVISGGVLAVTAIAGAAQAWATWRPERLVTRPRELPRGLQGVQISLSPWGIDRGAGLLLGGRF